MSNTTTTDTTIADVLAACLQASSDAITAKGSRGASLHTFAAFTGGGGDISALKKANAKARGDTGGKEAPPVVQRSYKLCSRYIKVQEFLLQFHLSFDCIGRSIISEKRSVTINLIERATRTDSEDVATAAFARGFQADPTVRLTAVERVLLGDAAEDAAVKDGKVKAEESQAKAFAHAVAAAVAAEIAKQPATRPVHQRMAKAA